MDNLYSSFYLYKKYEIIGDELIDLGITSIDADGTQEAVMKEECDPACGCPEPIYRWVQTEDTVCVGEEPAVQYRWTACGTTCDNANKYQNNIKEQSLDEGLTWTVVIPEEYSASTLVQQDSYDCGYRTGTTSSSTYCNGDDLYVDVYYRTSRDSGTTWVTASTTPTLVEAGGCATPTIEYRWTQSGTTCIGYDKYQNNIKEQSTDGGVTWTVVIPEEYSASTLIESQSTDCGYVPPTPASPKFTLTLSDSSTVTAECDSTSAITRNETSAYSASVASAVIGDCVTSIGRNAFRECASLTSVTIPDNVTNIDRDAFYICTGLTSISVLHSVTTIGNYAFSYCSSLTSCTIGSGVTYIGDAAFSGCTSLTSVTCLATTPPRLATQTTYNRTFENTNDCPIYVPCESVSAYQAATNWSTYASRIEGIPPCGQPTPTIDGKYQLTLNDSSVVTAECDSSSGITAGEVSNQYSGSVVSAEIGDCVTSIDQGTFYKCYSLTSVTIPNSVTSIGQNAFMRCSGLTSIDIPNSVTSIGDWAFQGCSGLTSVTIPSGVTSIGSAVFNHCSGLTSAIILNTSIGGGIFGNCISLTSVTIGTGVTSIGNYAFKYCSGLTSVTIPDSVTSIGSYAFQNCSSLTSVAIGSGVTSIDQGTFSGCTSLTGITIPDSVTSIGQSAFRYCSSLTSIDIPNSVTSIGDNVFFGCSGLTSVTIPSGVTSIGNYAFYKCYSLRSVTIPNSVTSIGQSAFSDCDGLVSIVIPSGVTEIGPSVFYACDSLRSVTVLAVTPPALGNNAFTTNSNCIIYVPAASLTDYQTAWPTYASRIQPIP